MALLVAPVLFVALLIYVAYPLLREGAEGVVDETLRNERERLLAEKEEILAGLKDIEMDYRMGKLSDEDYKNIRTDFEFRAVKVLKRLEKLPDGKAPPADPGA